MQAITGKGNTLEHIASCTKLPIPRFIRIEDTGWFRNQSASRKVNKEFKRDVPIIVRSDLRANGFSEDGLGLSFAGLLESVEVYNHSLLSNAFDTVRDSINTSAVKGYAERKSVSLRGARVDFIVQEIPRLETTGCMIEHPNRKGTYLFEAWKKTTNQRPVHYSFVARMNGQKPIRAEGSINTSITRNIISYYQEIKSLDAFSSDISYQMEFGINPEGRHAHVFQFRPFRPMQPSSDQDIRHLQKQIGTKNTLFSSFCIGVTPEEGVELPLVAEPYWCLLGNSFKEALMSRELESIKKQMAERAGKISGPYAAYIDTYRPFSGLDAVLSPELVYSPEPKVLIQSHDMFRMLESTRFFAQDVQTPGVQSYDVRLLHKDKTSVRYYSNGIEGLVVLQP